MCIRDSCSMKPNTFTTGTAMMAPRSVLTSSLRNTWRMISTPLSSSPWIAPDSQMVGPGWRPLTTATGIDRREPVGSRATGISKRLVFPGSIVSSPRVTGALRSVVNVCLSLLLGRLLGVVLDEADDRAGDVGLARLLDALEPRRRVHLQNDRAPLGLQHVDAGDVEAHRLGGLHRARSLAGAQLDLLGGAAPVEVGAEVAGCT